MLTLFSGLGLGTLLLPVFAAFFRLDEAVAMTAVVHFANNLFKVGLLGKQADRGIVARFGVPAVVASFFGAWVLVGLSKLPPLAQYTVAGREMTVAPVALAVAVVMGAFAMFELSSRFDRLAVDPRHLAWGGALSGFFGGLSGHQGAFRSAFLVRAGLRKEAFVATGVIVACLVDITRLAVYAAHLRASGLGANGPLLLLATASAFVGALLGARLLKEVSYRAVRTLVAVMLLALSGGVGSGLL